MLVRKVLIAAYRDGQYGVKTERLVNPTWKQLEARIHELDRLFRPFLWFYTEPDAEDGDQPNFEIIGGNGVFAIQSRIDGNTWSYYDPSKGDKEVAVWESDQGASVPEKSTCSDVQAVLRITK